jgi:hypothetical protein
VISSKDILEAARTCWNRCAYDGRRIDSNTFEPVKARGDFLYCAFHALWENIYPFFGTVTSILRA